MFYFPFFLFFFSPGWPHLTILLHNTHQTLERLHLFPFSLLAHKSVPTDFRSLSQLEASTNMHGNYCFIHSPHTCPGVKVGNMRTKPTPGPRTIGSKPPVCVCPGPGRPAGDAGPSGSDGGDGDGDQDDDDHSNDHGSDHGNGGAKGKDSNQASTPTDLQQRGTSMAKCSRPSLASGMRRKGPISHNICYTPLRAPPPPPSRGNSPSAEDSSSVNQSDAKATSSQSMSTFQRMLTPQVFDSNSTPKKQSSEVFRVSYWSGNYKRKPNKTRVVRTIVKEAPSEVKHPDPQKQKAGGFLERQKKTQEKQKKKQKRCCDQRDRARDGSSDNDADNECETSHVSSNQESSVSSTTHVVGTTPAVTNLPVTSYYGKYLANVAHGHTADNQDPVTPSTSSSSNSSNKRKRDDECGSQPSTPASPLGQRPVKRVRSSPGSSPLSPSPMSKMRKRTPGQQRELKG